MFDSLKLKFIIDQGLNIINNLNNNKYEYIDPTSLFITLAINSYKPIGTKLSICDNKVSLNESGIFQSSVRTLYGDKKTDIKLLYQSILYGSKIYKKKSFKNFDILLNKSLDGLKKLKETYDFNYDIIICINNYIEILKSINKEEDLSYKNVFEIQNIKNDNDNVNNIKEMIFDKLHSIWTPKKFKIIIYLLQELNEEDDLYRDKIIQSIFIILDGINIKTKNILNNLFIKQN